MDKNQLEQQFFFNIEVMYNFTAYKQVSKQFNHERCATNTLNLTAPTDIDKARSRSNPSKKLYDAAMTKYQVVWDLCSRCMKSI